jgi:GTP-binding protein EngB required for normal cell division
MCGDSVLKEQTVKGTVETVQLYQPIQCEIIDGNTEKSKNVLKMIGIVDDDLRLNILLMLTRRTGITAVIDHPRPINKQTRFLYIFYGDREKRLPDDVSEARKHLKFSWYDAKATHIITAVSFGIDIVVVLQLPGKEQIATKIDIALGKIRARLKNVNDSTDFTIDDANVLEKIREIKVYSNVTELAEMASLRDICRYIDRLKKKPDLYRPLIYTLRTIEWLYPNSRESCTRYTSIKKENSEKLEDYLIEILEQMKKIKYSLDSNASDSLPVHIKESLQKAQKEWQNLRQASERVIKQLADLVYNIHSSQNDASEIDDALKHKDQTALKENIMKLKKQVLSLETEIQSINSSNQRSFKHLDLFEPEVSVCDNKQKSDHMLVVGNEKTPVVSPNDKLIENNKTKPSIEQEIKENKNQQKPSSSPSENKNYDKTSPPIADEIVNILLLGESGVGKSTFINAFVNYLKFETFKQAESSKPVVLIPVSFLITTGNNFEEHTVKFGDPDSLNNEDFDHPGQSVTQNCKSYVFDIGRKRGLKFRIIDTPGFGDTRGIDQDDLNMQHILEYINNFDHLNAVCFLLKPNTSQINTFFRTCLTQLLDLLGSNIHQNIIFCFTNARSTFYAPGDTAPLLKDILKSLSIPDIPFNKNNTFCFDNESFRYLVALQNLISFDDQDKQEYEMSWSKSVDESKRLRDYIRRKLSACSIGDEHQSIKRAQLQITHMIRPILEAMRNIIRNGIIYATDSPNKWIQLKPRPLCRPAAFCFTCERDFTLEGNFWIACDDPHEIQKKCYSCDCDLSQHKLISYKLEYKYSNKSSSHREDDMKERLNLLRSASAEFAYFLTEIARSSKDDPFFIGMIEMIGEENGICESRKPNEMNLKLVKGLTRLLDKYEQRISDANSNQQHSKLSVIYEWIQTISEYPEVKIQLEAVRKTQEEIMKLYEYKVPTDLANTLVRSTATS